MKEDLCYISDDVCFELRSSKKQRRQALDPFGGLLKKSFVLPDFSSIMRGFVKPDGEPEQTAEQLLVMETERFSVPEILFNPSDVGIDQAGVAEATWQSLQSLSQVLKNTSDHADFCGTYPIITHYPFVD